MRRRRAALVRAQGLVAGAVDALTWCETNSGSGLVLTRPTGVYLTRKITAIRPQPLASHYQINVSLTLLSL